MSVDVYSGSDFELVRCPPTYERPPGREDVGQSRRGWYSLKPQKGRRIRELTALIQRGFRIPDNSFELYVSSWSLVPRVARLSFLASSVLRVRSLCSSRTVSSNPPVSLSLTSSTTPLGTSCSVRVSLVSRSKCTCRGSHFHDWHAHCPFPPFTA